MSPPYFSVVIPTRNRSFLVRHAIASLLNQTFRDFEIIVADNDESDATTQVIREFSDPRIIHVRTGDLSMPDNWEAGCNRARGRYICVMEDKQAFKYRSLERIHNAVKKSEPLAVKWQSDTFEDGEPPLRLRRAKAVSAAPSMISSDDILHQFCVDLAGNYKALLPLPQHGAFHQKLARQIRESVMGRLFHPVSPDVVLSLLTLNAADEILEIPAALVVYTSTTQSNGSSSAVRGELFLKFLREIGFTENQLYDRVPLKTISIPGCIFNDFQRLRERVGGCLAQHEICWTKFFFETQVAIWQTASRGCETSEQQDAWDAGLAEQSDETRTAVRAALSTRAHRPRSSSSGLRRFEKAIGFNRLTKRVKSFVRGRIKGDIEWRFRNVKEYLEWESRQESET